VCKSAVAGFVIAMHLQAVQLIRDRSYSDVLLDATKLLPLLIVADGCCPSIIIETMYRVNVISAVNQTF
jgi:hypothetical protein